MCYFTASFHVRAHTWHIFWDGVLYASGVKSAPRRAPFQKQVEHFCVEQILQRRKQNIKRTGQSKETDYQNKNKGYFQVWPNLSRILKSQDFSSQNQILLSSFNESIFKKIE